MEYAFGDITVACSNVDRVMFPADGITKGELLTYYRDVAELMIPELRGRSSSTSGPAGRTRFTGPTRWCSTRRCAPMASGCATCAHGSIAAGIHGAWRALRARAGVVAVARRAIAELAGGEDLASPG